MTLTIPSTCGCSITVGDSRCMSLHRRVRSSGLRLQPVFSEQ